MVAESIGAAEPAAVQEGEKGKHFEALCGILIAIFAAVLAVTDLGAGKYGDDELIAHNEKNNAYLWYQSKGIKETLVEGQRDTLKALVDAGSIRPEQLPAVQGLVQSLEGRVDRYGKEKKEILLGSSTVGEANWVQDVDGKMGQVVGAKHWESQAIALGGVGDVFDNATLFLQMCLVLGAISLVLQKDGTKKSFFYGMIALGLIGTVFSCMAFSQAFGIA
jgi:energy-converting hydrogenase Eha subunit C